MPRFGLRIFESKAFQKFVASLGNGILEHRAAIGWDDIKNVKVLVPPRDQQQALLDYLDQVTEKLDRLARLRERQIELLAEYRASLIHECVTGQRPVPNN